MNPHQAALAAELRRLDALVAREMRRLRARYELSLDELHGLYVTDQRVEALLRSTRSPEAPDEPPDARSLRSGDESSRWHALAAALRLDDDERDLLLLGLACELDAKYETLFAYLNDDAGRRWPTAELAIRLLGRDEAHRNGLRARLQPGAALLSCGALELACPAREEGRSRRALRAAAPLSDWLRGLEYADERLSALTRAGDPRARLPAEAFPSGARAALEGLVLRLERGTAPACVLLGADSAAEAALVAEELFARAGRPLWILDLVALRAAGAPAESVAALELAQHVLGIGLLATPLEALLEGESRVTADCCAASLRRLARRSKALVCATSGRTRARDVLGDVEHIDLVLPPLAPAERAAAWREILALDGRDEEHEPLVLALSDRFGFGLERIASAARAAREAARLAGLAKPSAEELFAAARAVSAEESGGTTRTIASAFGWEDLVLPVSVKDRLAELVDAIEKRALVLDAWGFGPRVGGGRGVNVVFAGPSGTGKTMAASIVARTLRLDLYRLELGTVVSKYIGETEKNLDRAFEAARRANAVLFIDEADALFGKRSEVKDAHDRYANIETAYLLQKMDGHDGIVVLATNLANNIDEAFSRRMHYVIEFPMPDAASREALWRGLLPASAPLAADLDLPFLARQFPFSGGDIRNVVLDAAYASARDMTPIGMRQVLASVARQYTKRGTVPTAMEFREYYGLLGAAPEVACSLAT